MLAPQSATQSTRVYCQPLSPSRIYASYRHVQSIALGVTQIVIGVLCIIFNAVSISYGDSVGVVSHGFWSGILFIVTGSLGIGAAKTKSKCLIASFMVMCIISAVMTISLLAVGIIGAALASPRDDDCPTDYSYGYECRNNYDYYCSPSYRPPPQCHTNYRVVTAMEALLAILALIEAAVAIWGSVICCQTVFCCSGGGVNPTAGVPQDVYPNQMMFVGTQQQQMQNGSYQPMQTFPAQYWSGQGTTPIASHSNQYPPPQMASANQAMGPPAYNTTIDQHNTPTAPQTNVGSIQIHPAFRGPEKY